MAWTWSPSRLTKGWPAWKFILIFTLSLILVASEWSAEAAPASPWNQPGLNLIFKPDLVRGRLKNSSKDSGQQNGTPAALKSGDSSSSSVASSDKGSKDLSSGKRLRKFPSHSWGYTRYGQDIGHIRHIASRKQNLPNNLSVPCPRDYVKLFNGKCRRVPKFSSSRVG